jgi:hypothetical protein
VAPVSADLESCDQCKYLNCLKSSVERKQKLIKVYEGLLNFWNPHSTYDNASPQMVMDLSKLTEPSRSSVYVVIINQLKDYALMEESRTAAVPAADRCGYSDAGVSVQTESFETCATEGLGEAQKVQPCKELAALIAAHEGEHVKTCRQRQQPNSAYWRYVYTGPQGQQVEKMLPPKILTPVGAASGEIAAYQLEIAGLKPIIEKLEKKCRKLSFKGVTIDCTIRTPVCSIRTGQKLAGSVCGDPVAAPWTITPHYFAEGCGAPPSGTGGDKPFTNDCVPAGSDEEKRRTAVYANARGTGAGGWMCVYSDDPQPKITIRSFRLSVCEGAAEQTVTVNAEVSPNCDEPSQPPVPAPPPRMPPNS